MTLEWPGSPSPRATASELADYAELETWSKLLSSHTSIVGSYDIIDDNNYFDGVLEDNESESYVEDAFFELERRSQLYQTGYPFNLNQSGTALSFNANSSNTTHVIYLFLLLATRLDMKNNKVHAGIDGTLLFEDLSAEVAKIYFGDGAKSLAFSRDFGRFPDKIKNLTSQIAQGNGFKKDASTTAVDDGLDIVVWIPFSDGEHGKFIGFGQCKTGTHYKRFFGILQPDAFCDNWIEDFRQDPPVKLFYIADSLSRDITWKQNTRKAGIIFDRCRIVGICNSIDPNLLENILAWTNAAAVSTGLVEL